MLCRFLHSPTHTKYYILTLALENLSPTVQTIKIVQKIMLCSVNWTYIMRISRVWATDVSRTIQSETGGCPLLWTTVKIVTGTENAGRKIITSALAGFWSDDPHTKQHAKEEYQHHVQFSRQVFIPDFKVRINTYFFQNDWEAALPFMLMRWQHISWN